MFPPSTSAVGSSVRWRISPLILRSQTSSSSSTHPLALRLLFFRKRPSASKSKTTAHSEKSHRISTCHENRPSTHSGNLQSHEEGRGKSRRETSTHGRSDGGMERWESRRVPARARSSPTPEERKMTRGKNLDGDALPCLRPARYALLTIFDVLPRHRPASRLSAP